MSIIVFQLRWIVFWPLSMQGVGFGSGAEPSPCSWAPPSSLASPSLACSVIESDYSNWMEMPYHFSFEETRFVNIRGLLQERWQLENHRCATYAWPDSRIALDSAAERGKHWIQRIHKEAALCRYAWSFGHRIQLFSGSAVVAVQ